MTILLIILAVVLVLVGLVGAVVPGLAGPPFSWAALLLLSLTPGSEFSWPYLLAMAVVAVAITVLDYAMPSWGTRRLGGTRAGSRGSNIGLVVSVLVLPLLGITIGPFGIVGLLAGPFVGAYAGEVLSGNRANALRSAWGSFVGFLSGTFMKLCYALVALVSVVIDLIR